MGIVATVGVVTKGEMMSKLRKFELLKDIVIPKGTVFQERFGKTEYVSDMFQHVFGLTKDTSGTVTYGIDHLDESVKDWFKEVE